jgi:hypothetical protein
VKDFDVASSVKNFLLIENMQCDNFVNRILGMYQVLICKCLAVVMKLLQVACNCRN